MVLIVSLIGTLIMHFIVLDNSNFIILFVLILEFGLSMIMFAFIMTTLFSKAKSAAAAGGLISIMAACFFYIQVSKLFSKSLSIFSWVCRFAKAWPIADRAIGDLSGDLYFAISVIADLHFKKWSQGDCNLEIWWSRSCNRAIFFLNKSEKKSIQEHWVCNVFHVFRIEKGYGNSCFIRKSRIITYITTFFQIITNDSISL